MADKHRVVIVGGGFGGLYAAQSLKRATRTARAALDITLLDRHNYHVFQPLLYQVATGALSPANIAAPLRSILKGQKNTRVLMAEVTGLDVANRQVLLESGSLPYDSLIIATGVRHHYFGNEKWEPLAPGLKTIEEAINIRRRILSAFEAAEREPDPVKQAEWLTFVVVGGGPTGVELAGAIGEIAHHTLQRDFRAIDPASARILLVEGDSRILRAYPPELSANAGHNLARIGVTIHTDTLVTEIRPGGVSVQSGADTRQIATHTVLWAAGIQASPLARILADEADASLDSVGRVVVEPDLTVPGHPELFVIGDLAHFSHQTGDTLPGVAQVAMQQGRYAARLIQARLRGKTLPPFHYVDLGNMATVGRAAAVADLRGLKLTGFAGWVVWLFIHLMNLVHFQNRLLVFVQWAWNYFTRNRSARLITGEDVLPFDKQ